jgi:uncharacterized protein
MNYADNQWDRLAMIAELAEKTPVELGRTALMKYAYFLQTLRGVPLGYHFSLYAYGPFDADVLDDLDYAQTLGAVQVKTAYYARGYGYNISPSTAAAEIKAKAQDFVTTHQVDIEWVVKEFGGLSAAQLELASTTIFVDRDAQRTREPLSMEELARRAQEIKPRFTEQQIRTVAESLQNRGLLRSTQS